MSVWSRKVRSSWTSGARCEPYAAEAIRHLPRVVVRVAVMVDWVTIAVVVGEIMVVASDTVELVVVVVVVNVIVVILLGVVIVPAIEVLDIVSCRLVVDAVSSVKLVRAVDVVAFVGDMVALSSSSTLAILFARVSVAHTSPVDEATVM